MTDHSLTIDLTKYIARTLFKDGRPHLRGRRMTVYWVAEAARNMTIDAIAKDFSLEREQILAALLYYEEHRAEVDAFEQAIDDQYGHLYPNS